jgi:hypothetical protein
MHSLITANYEGLVVTFRDDGWFNATEVAGRYGKSPSEWLRLPTTEEYLAALERKYGKIPYLKAQRGKSGGTWLHPKLAVRFAQWLDIDFAIWCDEQIDLLIRGNHPHTDWQRLRHEAASSFKVMNHVLQLTRQSQGKSSSPHHYINEAKLINGVLTGEFKGLDRDKLSTDSMGLLAALEAYNAVQIGCGMSYQTRKTALFMFADDWRKTRSIKQVA